MVVVGGAGGGRWWWKVVVVVVVVVESGRADGCGEQIVSPVFGNSSLVGVVGKCVGDVGVGCCWRARWVVVGVSRLASASSGKALET